MKQKFKSKKSGKQKRLSEIEEIQLLSSWIQSQKPDSGSNPMSLPPLPANAPVARIDAHTYSRYAGATRFDQLPISKKTKDGLRKAEYVDMTDIQRASLPHALSGRDILGAAKTGSGKTLAFLIPVLEKLYRERWGPEDGVGSIIISPTRELGAQLFDVLKAVGEYHNLSAGLLIGGRKDVNTEKEHVNELNILVCTPGRLLQHMDETPNFDCSQLQVLVLDEADRILDVGFKKTLNAIISQLPKHRQTFLFSATQTKSVQDLARLSLKDPEYLSVHEESVTATPNRLQQTAMVVPLEQKPDMLWSFIKAHLNSKILVFLSSCKQVKFVFETFKKLCPGIPLMCLHGRMKQDKRMGIYSEFCEKRSVLFSTDVASRGLDFNKAVDWVVQVDCPEDVASYIHRVGHTARYHSGGRSVLFLMPSEMKVLEQLQSAKVPIQLIKANTKRLQPVSGLLSALLVKYPNFQQLAQRAFITYLRSIHIQKDKEIFDVMKLPIDEFSASMGLPMTPKIRFIDQKRRSQKESANSTFLALESSYKEDAFKTSDGELEYVDFKESDFKESDKGLLLPADTPSSEVEDAVPPTRILKKKKLKINVHGPVGTKTLFDEAGKPVARFAKLADTKSSSDALVVDIKGIKITMESHGLNGKFSINGCKTNNVSRNQRIAEQRKSLPIASVEKLLVQEVHKNDTLIIVGETGSGKTTQIPQFLYNAGFCRDGKAIGVTQPRRVAAVTVAKRVAEECGVEVGQKVGYSIRFEDVTSSSTRIKYMTDGLLLREALLDPYLSRYSVIIVDEAHERTVNTDVLLGFLKKVQKARSRSLNHPFNTENMNVNSLIENGNSGKYVSSLKQCQGRKLPPLKLIIMSASLDARLFSEYFGGARAVHVQGRQYPVALFYTCQPQSDYLEASLFTIFQIHLKESPGDILAFLTGQEEIESMENLVKDKIQKLPEGKRNLVIIPIYSALPSEQQLRVFAPTPPGVRKVILATNIAETSLTIPGIKYVIDPGFVKARTYDPNKGMESLIVILTSKAQALQRSGRAGREGPGKCFRLYTEITFDKLENSTKPEIKRCNLSNVILQLKALGVDDITGFDFLEKPSRQAVLRSLEQLLLLGALTDDGKLSDPVGHQMAHLPLDPIYSKALIVASQSNCLEEMLITVSMLSVESIFYSPREKLEEARAKMKCFSSVEGDHLTLIDVYRSAEEFLNKKKSELSKEKVEKSLRKWCKENFINSRSLRHARDIHSQIRGHVEQMGLPLHSCEDDMLQFRRCLAASFFLNAATKQPDGTYRDYASGEVVQIHPSSVLFRKKPDCVIFNEFVQTNHKYIRNITRIDQLWLTELAPHYYALQN